MTNDERAVLLRRRQRKEELIEDYARKADMCKADRAGLAAKRYYQGRREHFIKERDELDRRLGGPGGFQE
jgi:hypothetical protein